MDEMSLLYLLKQSTEIKQRKDVREQVKKAMSALQALTRYLYENGIQQIPSNLCEYYQFLEERPLCDYITCIKSVEPFYDAGIVNKEVEELFQEENLEEIQQNAIVGNGIRFFREKLQKLEEEKSEDTWIYIKECEEEYVRFRLFLSETEFRDSISMEYDIANLNVPAEIVQILKKSFSCKKHYGKDVEVCPVCGKPIMEKRENICDNEVCNWYIQKEKLEPKTIKLQGKAMELLPGIYRFCLSPGIAERKIYQKLKDLYGADHVFLYPHVDRYDIDVQKNGKAVHLDIKDVKNPLRLFKTLTETSDLSKLFYSKENPVYLVIPEHRISIYTQTNRNLSYIEQLRSYLTEAGMDIRVIREARLPVMLNSEWRCQDEPLS
ncbi:hypothetical protein [Blautia hansenii]|uniref:restriction endonuclease-related protein n=1 Tax=Blautia hansenii TaxID=1322 RepID=UPI0039840726